MGNARNGANTDSVQWAHINNISIKNYTFGRYSNPSFYSRVQFEGLCAYVKIMHSQTLGA